MTTDADFLTQILAVPDDDVPRLIYADWLEELGDPRSEFIRVQCEIARIPRDDPRAGVLKSREAALLKKHGKRWSAKVRPLVKRFQFRRGFIEAVDISAEALLANARVLFESAPINEIGLSDLRNHVERVAESTFLERIDSLHVMANQLGVSRTVKLASSPHLHRLKTLTVAKNGIGVDGFRTIVESPHLGNLRRLEVASNLLGDAAILGVADCPALHRITHLNLFNNDLRRASWQALAESPNTSSLEFLDLGLSRVGNLGWQTLCAVPRWPKLKGLGLGSTDATDTASLASWPTLAQLETLILDLNRLGPKGLTPLANSPLACNLQKLDVTICRIGDEGISRLVQSPFWNNLRALSLRYCDITSEGARALLSRPKSGALRMLDLSSNKIDETMLAELNAHFGARVCVTGNDSPRGISFDD